MKGKAKLVLSSVATMALFGAIAAGGTYALFSSASETNIAVTAGKVDLKAVIGDLDLYSPALINLDGTIQDDANIATATAFGNGGTAVLSGRELTLTNITPGDKLTTEIDVANASNILSKSRFTLKATEGEDLFHELDIKINGELRLPFASATKLETLDPGVSPADKLTLEISLPTDVGNAFAGKTTKLTLAVEGYQGNTYVEDYDYALLGKGDFDAFADLTKTMDFKDVAIMLQDDIDLAGRPLSRKSRRA